MKIHEYQAKEIFRRFGVPMPRGEMVTTPEEARQVAQKLATPSWSSRRKSTPAGAAKAVA